MRRETIRAALRLFHAIQVAEKTESQEPDEAVLADTIKKGYILDPAIKPTPEILEESAHLVLDAEKANAAFHKSWKVIADTPQETLWLQAVIHYITTYGFEELGIYQAETIYIPQEELRIPELEDDLPLVVIRAMTSEEILEGIKRLGSGMALSEEVLGDIMELVEANDYPPFMEEIKNRELAARLYAHYGLAPTDPEEYLRYVIYRLTGDSLLIKNKELIATLRNANGEFVDDLLEKAPKDLATIFYRFKPLFLALKHASRRKKAVFNRLRKDAVRIHRPLPKDYLNDVTQQIARGQLVLAELRRHLGRASIWRKARLAQALNLRLQFPDAILYRIRNGKGWVESFEWPAELQDATQAALDTTLASLASDLSVGGHTVYIPNNVHYAFPASEKKFVGPFPEGSFVEVPDNMIAGVWWQDVGRYRIDLDLSALSVEGKVGWNSRYKSADQSVLFSGDMTAAPPPDGASELFYYRADVPYPQLMFLNYYNYIPHVPVDAKIFIASEPVTDLRANYVVNPNNIILEAEIQVTRRSAIVGLVLNSKGANRFYILCVSTARSIASSDDIISSQARMALVAQAQAAVELADILERAGATIVDQPQQRDDPLYHDLSPKMLSKSTINELLR